VVLLSYNQFLSKPEHSVTHHHSLMKSQLPSIDHSLSQYHQLLIFQKTAAALSGVGIENGEGGSGGKG
jgi:hypothetical protein